jgi:hypothetical protein
MISGNMVGSYSQMGKTFIITDESGAEITGVIVGQEVLFDATDNDVREGKTYASDIGVSTGTKFIPSYVTSEGYVLITNGNQFVIKMLAEDDKYDFTKLQLIICPYNSSIEKSVAAEKIGINEGVYAVNSTELLATVTKDNETKTINLGLTNDSGKPYVLRYFTYKEIY